MRKLVLLALLMAALAGAVVLLLHKPKPHHVALGWKAPLPATQSVVAGYNIYRGTASHGPYVKIASGVKTTSYDDWLVVPGRTYYYVVTTVDTAGKESRYSNETKSVIP